MQDSLSQREWKWKALGLQYLNKRNCKQEGLQCKWISCQKGKNHHEVYQEEEMGKQVRMTGESEQNVNILKL